MSTSTCTKRSPRPRPRRCGTPSPFSRTTWPLWVPAATATLCGSSRVSTSSWVPSAAWATPTCRVACRSSPARSNRLSGVTERWTNSEPLGPPRGPAGPRSASRRVEPSSTPAGTSTTKLRSSIRRPSPRQAGHGSGMVCPSPWHRPQATAVTTWPSRDWRMRRISPVPRQSGHSVGEVPGLAPTPLQVSQDTGSRTASSRRAPKAASAKVSTRFTSASEPGWGPRRRPRPPPVMVPKNASKRSPRPASKSKPIPPAPPPWPKLAGPSRS